MDLPSLAPTSATGDSLVGTLLGLGLMLVMVAAGVALVTGTQALVVPIARIQTGPATSTPCPPTVRDEQGASETRTCMNLVVQNLGDAAGTASCTISDLTPGVESRFAANGAHITSTNVQPGATEELLVRIDGAGDSASPLVVDCGAVATGT
ncbi:MAG: hypothetical protein H0W82_07265 [Actinobacteria bacterium]|nr:hypothetical protein [Actinomycetota bacterium]